MDTAAISRGRRARKEPKTKAKIDEGSQRPKHGLGEDAVSLGVVAVAQLVHPGQTHVVARRQGAVDHARHLGDGGGGAESVGLGCEHHGERGAPVGRRKKRSWVFGALVDFLKRSEGSALWARAKAAATTWALARD